MQTRPLILTNSSQAETNLSPPRVLGKVAFLDSWQLLEKSLYEAFCYLVLSVEKYQTNQNVTLRDAFDICNK